MDILRGDVEGVGNYGDNTAARRPDDLFRSGIVLERMGMEPDEDIWPVPYASTRCAAAGLGVSVVQSTPEVSVVTISGVMDDCRARWSALNSSWTLTLRSGERHADLTVEVTVVTAVDASAVLLSVYLGDPMSVGMFDEGTVAIQSR